MIVQIPLLIGSNGYTWVSFLSFNCGPNAWVGVCSHFWTFRCLKCCWKYAKNSLVQRRLKTHKGAVYWFIAYSHVPHFNAYNLYAFPIVTLLYVHVFLQAGESGSADTVRDPRGFAMKFYTEEGNWDLVGNNTPIFFIRDALLVSRHQILVKKAKSSFPCCSCFAGKQKVFTLQTLLDGTDFFFTWKGVI